MDFKPGNAGQKPVCIVPFICAFFVWFFYLPAQALAALSLACQTGNPAPCTATPDPAHEV